MFGFDHPLYRSLWVRVVVVAFPAIWGVWEFFTGSPLWGVLFCGAAAAAYHGLFMTYNPPEPDDEKTE